MALTYSDPVRLGTSAPEFSLLGTDGLHHHLTDFRYAKVLVVAFICNHCPYVQAIQGRLSRLARELRERSVQFVAISSNDTARYPADGLEGMRKQAAEQGFEFPYLLDETQSVARAYGAVCTPDFFVFEQVRPEAFREADEESAVEHYRDSFKLRYRGRLDDSWKDEKAVQQEDLRQAIEALLLGNSHSLDQKEQKPSLGCSIKWR